MTRWPEARAVAWARFPGAYGTSRDVAAALETLRYGADAEDDAFSDAWLDLLTAHAWHQGTLYPLTAKVLPFVFDIVDAAPALAVDAAAHTRREIASFVLRCAAAVRYALAADDAESRANGRAVLDVLTAHEARLRTWAREGLADVAIPTMLNVPALRDRMLAAENGKRDARTLLAIVLGAAAFLGGPVLEWAARVLSAIAHPVAERAAALLRDALARNDGFVTRLDAERLAELGRCLPRGDDDVTAALDPLRERFGIAVPRPDPSHAGEAEAIVTTTDDDWFVASLGGARRVTIRWPSHPFVEGDRVVLIDIDHRNVARAVRGTEVKAIHRREL